MLEQRKTLVVACSELIADKIIETSNELLGSDSGRHSGRNIPDESRKPDRVFSLLRCGLSQNAVPLCLPHPTCVAAF